MYLNAQQRVRGQDKTHPQYKGLPICTHEEFYKFAETSNYGSLYDAWVNDGYKLRFTPTIDRLDKTRGYVLGNIEIVTMTENLRRRSYSIH